MENNAMVQKALTEYETDNGKVTLSPQIVKRYLVNGDAERITDQEVMMFLNLCKYQKLNPFLREAYLIKFGNTAATMVTGKDVFTKRAAKSKLCNGYEAGIVVQKKNGDLDYRKGTLIIPGEKLVGGWANVHRKDWNTPLEITVSLAEYERKNKDGSSMGNWSKMPATMIRKVALVQALREAMPEEFQGLYSPEEMPVDDSKLDSNRVEIDESKLVEVDTEQMITKAQGKRITELMQEKGLEANDVKLISLKIANKSNSKELTYSEADKLINELENTHEQTNEDEAAFDTSENDDLEGTPLQ